MHGSGRPGDAARPLHLLGADIDADHGYHGGAEAEEQRNLNVIEAERDAISGNRIGAEAPDGGGDERDREIDLDRRAGKNRSSSMSNSYRQPVLLSQAFVECGLRHKTAQQTDLARHFSCRVASFRRGSCCRFQDYLRYNFRGIAFFHRFRHGNVHAGAGRIIDVERLIRLDQIFSK